MDKKFERELCIRRRGPQLLLITKRKRSASVDSMALLLPPNHSDFETGPIQAKTVATNVRLKQASTAARRGRRLAERGKYGFSFQNALG
jgi:hypothetical protein